ncbi:MAG: aminoglycoside N(3)-acetyltransferase [Anaerolineales bacterium]|nr:aminoglycoside N(3)-acetyltransferase [Anaerolineales bacterium]
MLSYRDFINTFRNLELGAHSRVLVHASLSSLGSVTGGAETVVGALLSTCDTVIMPAFTFRTMVTPPVGPADNALVYGGDTEQNRTAEIYSPDMPIDEEMGIIAEALRRQAGAERSTHPILSFIGVNATGALDAQTLEQPWAPIDWLAEYDADVVLLGVDHTVNVSLHYAEMKAGRRQFLRWALTREGIVSCPGFPGCSDGFQAITDHLEGIVRRASLGETVLEVIPLRDLAHVTVGWIREDPRALLCDRMGCNRCAAVRASVRVP